MEGFVLLSSFLCSVLFGGLIVKKVDVFLERGGFRLEKGQKEDTEKRKGGF